MSSELEERMKRAEERLPEWIESAVRMTQEELASEGELSKKDVELINRLDGELKRNGKEGIWENVDYSIYSEDGDVRLETFGVPMIPQDVNDIGVNISEKQRRKLNDVLSNYGVMISDNLEDLFEEWLESH